MKFISAAIDKAFYRAKIEGRAEGHAEALAEGRDAKGFAEGRIEGRAKGQWDVARAIVQDSIPSEKVAHYIGFRIEEIKSRFYKS